MSLMDIRGEKVTARVCNNLLRLGVNCESDNAAGDTAARS